MLTNNQRFTIWLGILVVAYIYLEDRLRFQAWRDKFRANRSLMPSRDLLIEQEHNAVIPNVNVDWESVSNARH